MPKSASSLSRRNFLRGGGACVALPYLETLVGAAGGAPVVRPPLRMGIFTVTGGTVIEAWMPTQVGPLQTLPSILTSLEPHKSELLILSNLAHSGQSSGLNAHNHCSLVHLTGADQISFGTRLSVDQRAAELVRDQSIFPSLEIGVGGVGEYQFSRSRTGGTVPYERDPRQVFDRMFRGRQMVAPNWTRRAAPRPPRAPGPRAEETHETQVVDLILEDARRLNRQLGNRDRHVLGDYLSSIDAIERRIAGAHDRLAQEALDVADPGPSRPEQPANLPATRGATELLLRRVPHEPTVHGEYIGILADLMVLAFQTDTTRVCTLAAGDDGALFPGVVTVGSERHGHTLEHNGNPGGNNAPAQPIAREGCRQIHAWYTQFFARVVEKMRAIDEGGSTLLDNSMLLYTSYMANGGHGTKNYPVVLAGRAGGSLRPGRHLRYQDETPMSNLYVEMLSRLGDTTGVFGNSRTSPKAAYNGRLPDLT